MVHISDLDIHSLHLHELRFGFIELAMLKVWHRTAEDTVCKQQTQRMDRLISSEDIYFFSLSACIRTRPNSFIRLRIVEKGSDGPQCHFKSNEHVATAAAHDLLSTLIGFQRPN